MAYVIKGGNIDSKRITILLLVLMYILMQNGILFYGMTYVIK
jgi:hypothetical protein